ncbi:MAG TPA: hypothetical protein VH107_04910 [Lacipirellulaceae bacterium]|nr:hypothetical protein [Lacipirellulaceae bacterium]
MPSFQTLFRATVMLGVGVVAVKAWQLYGPTNEQVKTLVAHGIEMARNTIQSHQHDYAGAMPDPRTTPRAGEPQQPVIISGSTSVIMPPAAALGQTEAPKLLPDRGAAPAAAPATPPIDATAKNAPDRVSELMSRLQKLGAADTNLAPWGSDGHLYRFSCRAPLASAPAMTQHFESVADQPAAAVEQVLAKVEAWQVAQREGGTLRY